MSRLILQGLRRNGANPANDSQTNYYWREMCIFMIFLIETLKRNKLLPTRTLMHPLHDGKYLKKMAWSGATILYQYFVETQVFNSFHCTNCERLP